MCRLSALPRGLCKLGICLERRVVLPDHVNASLGPRFPHSRHPRARPEDPQTLVVSLTFALTTDCNAGRSRSPPLWGRCPAGQRGVSAPHLRLTAKIPQQNQSPTPFFIHPLPTCRRVTPFRHRIHRTMRSPARRDRRRGGRLSQVESSGRCNGLPPREAEGETVRTGSPSPPLTRACLGGTQTGALGA
ncbi:hypothetical protein DFR48_11315 [Ciceribacter lividus]|uniref:Uncharacterized protein n=1 Tax=Ciceribacter lividus TaxID=1197950 RepID=A0A6I7HHM7_9HYPH|nr:hypothetical protein DFR48_11315 [Ciceribacter lividus]